MIPSLFFFSSPHLGGEVSTVRDHKLFLFMTSVTKILPLLSLGPSPSPQSSSLSSVSIVVTHKKAIIIMKKNSSESHKEEGKREGGRKEGDPFPCVMSPVTADKAATLFVICVRRGFSSSTKYDPDTL